MTEPAEKRPKSHTVVAGEDFATIAEMYDYTSWEYLYFHPSNDALRRLRKTPFSLAVDDVVQLPKLERLERVCATARKHTFKLKARSIEMPLNISFEDHLGAPYAECDFKLSVEGKDGTKSASGKTDADGWIHEKIPVSATTGTIKIKVTDDPEAWRTWTVEIGALPPVDTQEGQAQRLVNLGFLAEDGKANAEAVAQALAAFQAQHVSSDADVSEVLRQVHGS